MRTSSSRSTAVMLCCCLLFIAAQAHAGVPSWVEKRPSAPGWYIGIGTAEKRGTPEEYLLRAKHSALNEIASQITVAISGEQISRISEQMGKITDEYQAQLRSSTSAELEGVETVGTYEDDTQTWIYLRLNIDRYNSIRAEKRQRAAALALDYFTKAKSSEQAGRPAESMQLYLQALSALSKYLTEPVQATYNGRNVYLVNEIVQSLQFMLNAIEIESKNSPVEAQIGRPVKLPVGFAVKYMNASGVQKPAAMIPLRFSFLRGAGEIIHTATTDQNGLAATRIAKMTATDKLQMLQAEIDLTLLMAGDSVLNTIARGFSVPVAKTIVNVSGVSVFISTHETQFGREMRLPRIEPVLKGMLSNEGFSFVKQQTAASIVIDIRADSRQGSNTMGLCVAYADATISVIDMNSGDEIYKNSVSNIKGISDTYEKAGMKAFDEAAAVMKNEVIPLLLEKYRK
ncbi:MAG TPA: LPP20 family lipoprotein [Bacteroidota bacterium]|nr:LPP20 family lipoprotein [Bacteroidota bacterium]